MPLPLQVLPLLLPHLFLVRLDVPFGCLDALVPEQFLRRQNVLLFVVVVRGLGGPEVVALNRLAVLLEEAGEPQGQSVGRIASCTRWKHHSVMW